jgi:signal transduction protein with GAF and PtsI domain
LSLEQMLAELIGLVVSVTGCDACLVYLLEPAAEEIVLCASQLPHETEIGNIRMRIGEGVTGWVAQHQSVVALSSRASSDPRFKTFSSLPEDTYESFLSVPLITGGEVIGVINVHHRNVRAHSAEEVALLGYVAEQMAGAIVRNACDPRGNDFGGGLSRSNPADNFRDGGADIRRAALLDHASG